MGKGATTPEEFPKEIRVPLRLIMEKFMSKLDTNDGQLWCDAISRNLLLCSRIFPDTVKDCIYALATSYTQHPPNCILLLVKNNMIDTDRKS